MWKKTWLLGILMTATALSGCSSCGDNGGGGNDGGNTTADGGDGGGGGNPDGSVDPGDPTLSSLTIEPTNPVLIVSGSTGVTQIFKVTGTYTDGHTEDVSGKALFSIDDTRLGLFGGGSGFTSSTTVGGTSTVRARLGTMSVSTPITVKLDQKVSDTPPPGQTPATPVPADPGSKFGGTVDTSYKPEIVYPNNGVLVPPNLGQLEIHIKPNNASTTLFELAFSNSITDVRVYMRCYLPSGFTLPSGVSRGCIYTPTKDVWKFLAESNRGGQPVKLTVRSTDDSGTGKVGVSNPIAIQFARAELKGALYYWTTKTGSTGVMRYDFAGTGTTAASPVMLAKNIDGSVSCVGCHALSRNGKKLVAEVNGQNDGRLALADLSSFTADSKAKLGASRQSTFESWNPDGTKFVGVYGDSGATDFGLRIFNGDTGAYESSIPGTGDTNSPATHPDWSPDGQTIAYTAPTHRETNQRNYMGAIKMVTAKSGGGWNAPVTVVPAENGKHRYYPAIAPDNSFLVYNESVCDSGTAPSHYSCNGDTDKTAKLWAAKLQAGAPRVELMKANQGGVMDGTETKLTNSYPKWSPFVTRGNGDDKSRLMWVTFSSSRNYGLRTTPNSSGSSENDKSTLLWMAAVDPDKVNAGADPSYPAFALPFQDITTSNHIAQWAQYFVSNGCSTVGEGCGSAGSTCCNGLQCVQLNQDPPIPCDVEGACVCDAIPQCAPALEKCSAAAPCCDGLLCLDDVTGGSCSGSDCSCKPPCAGEGQACGSSACCDGLACVTESGSSTCQIILK